MNSNDVNSIIDNLCNKLGTTTGMLLPEMAGYNITRWSVGVIIALILITMGLIFVSRIVKMHKQDEVYLRLARDYLDEHKLYKGNAPSEDIIRQMIVNNRVVVYYEDDYMLYILGSSLSIGLGLIILVFSIVRIIGWHLMPHAMLFHYIMNELAH